MLKKLFLLILLSLLSLNVFAHGEQWLGFAVLAKDVKWSPVQISLWPVHLCNPRATIYGILLSPGIFGFADKVYGVSCGAIVMMEENNSLAANIWSFGDKNNGLAVGGFNAWAKNNGVSVGLANFVYDKKKRAEYAPDRHIQSGEQRPANRFIELQSQCPDPVDAACEFSDPMFRGVIIESIAEKPIPF